MDSLPRWVITHSHQWFQSAQKLVRDLQTGWVFTRSCQQFKSAQKLVSDSLPRWVFARSCQWSWSNTEEWLTNWMGIHRFSSVVPISTNKGEKLTTWMDVHPFLSVVLICSNTWEKLTAWMGVHQFSSVVLICLKTGEGLTSWMGVLPLLTVILNCSYSGEGITSWMSVFSYQWFWSSQTKERDTQPDECSPVLISSSDLIKHWRGTHILDGCSPVIVSSSDLLKHWGTHLLDEFSPFLSVVMICSNTGEGLTCWMNVPPFLSVWSAQTPEKNALTG